MNPPLQPELALRRRRMPAVIREDVRELERLLRGRGPLTAREIEELRLDWASPAHRYVRELASRSRAIVSAPGVAGYQLAEETPLPTLQAMAAARHAQIRAEARDLIRLRQLIALRQKAAALTAPAPPDSFPAPDPQPSAITSPSS